MSAFAGQSVWFVLPVLGQVRITTLLSAAILAGYVIRRERSWRGLWLAVLMVLAWASLYEVIYGLTGVVVHGWSFNHWAWVTAALAGWLLLAYHYKILPDRRVLTIFAVSWLIWVAFGFNSNTTNNNFDLSNEVLNVTSKTLLAISYLVHYYETKIHGSKG